MGRPLSDKELGFASVSFAHEGSMAKVQNYTVFRYMVLRYKLRKI